jgi:cobalt-zinc-cadmium resistance protein CzcA
MKIFLKSWFAALDRFLPLLICLLLLLIGIGIKIVVESEIQAFPNFTNTQVQVITQLPGKAPEEIERLVTLQVELGVAGIRGLQNTRSVSVFGLSVVTLTFEDGVIVQDARIAVSQRINDMKLPPGADSSLSPESTPIGEIFRYVIKGSATLEEQRLVQDWMIERKLKKVPGVADVVTFGGVRKVAEVRLEPQRLKTFGLDLNKVADIISESQGNAGGSPMKQGQEATLVRVLGMYENYSDLGASMLTSVNNVPVRVQDIGEVRSGHDLRYGQVGYKTDNDLVEGIILLRNGYDTVKTCEEIQEVVKNLNKDLSSKGIQIEPIYNRTELIHASEHTVLHNMVTGIVLVIILLILGLGMSVWRLTLAVALLIPLSLVFALVGVKFFNLTPNLISLGAIDFGILVETAIFAAEALLGSKVFHLVGKERDEKSVDVLSVILGPAFLSALLLAIAFIPILTLTGVEGRIFKPLGVTLICAVAAAQILTLLLVPLALKFVPKLKDEGHPPLEVLSHKFIHYITHKIGPLLPQRKVLFGAGGGLILLVIALFLTLGKEFMPTMNEGALYIRVIAPPSVSLDTSVELAKKIRQELETIPQARAIVTQVGRPDDGTDINGPEIIEALVRLHPPEQWNGLSIQDIIVQMEKKLSNFVGIQASVSQPIKDNVDEAISGVKGDLVLKFYGKNLDELVTNADKAAVIIRRINGVDSAIVDPIRGQPELRFKVNKEIISRFGLRVFDIASSLETALLGKNAGNFLDEEGRFIPILVKPLLEKEMNQNVLKTIPILNNSGTSFPLGDLVDVSQVEGISRIYRDQGVRTLAVKVNISKRAVVGFVHEAKKILHKELVLPEGMKTAWAGSFENAQRASKHLMIMVPLCFFFIGLLVLSWYQSFPLTCILFWEVPFALVGALSFLMLFGLNLSISAASGLVVVLGLALLNGMMFLEKYKIHKDSLRALNEAGAGIILSASVAIAGLVPAALSKSIGSETAKPFAVAILGGLVSSLILTLILLPIFSHQTKK